jgi:DNA-binding response OmpR family regulator
METRQKILIVEDDIDNLTIMTMVLKDEGYEVEGTLNGDETFIRTRRFKPDLILMDVYLLDSNGKDICRVLKNTKETEYIPVILISGNGQFEMVVKECGANGFINKPFDLSYLLNKVNGHLQQAVH